MKRRLRCDDLWVIPQLSDPQLSPDGSRVAYVLQTPDRASDGYRSNIWVVDVGSGAAEPVTEGPQDSAPRWSPDGSALAFTCSDDGPPQLWVSGPDGGEARRLTELDAGVTGDLTWSPDGRCIAVVAPMLPEGGGPSSNAGSPLVVDRVPYKMDGLGYVPAGFRLRLVNVPLDGSDPVPLTSEGLLISSPTWSPDGQRLAYIRVPEGFARDGVSSVWVTSLVDGTCHQVSDDRWHQAVAWAPDGDSLLLVASDMRSMRFARLLTAPAEGGGPQELAPGFDHNIMVGGSAYPGAPPRFTGDGGMVLFCARDRGCSHVYEVPAQGGRPRKIFGGEEDVVAGMSAASDRMAVIVATPTTTGEVHVVDRGDGDSRRLTSMFEDALPDVELFTPEARSFTSSDGTQLEGWLLRGDHSAPAPLLLDIHGGPHNAWSPAFDGWHLYQQVLAARGWSVLMLNPRGSDGYGEVFYRAILGNWGLADEDDFLSAVDDLMDRDIADPSHLAVGGYSYGGYMTCWLTARTQRFAAAVPAGVATDLVGLSGTTLSGVMVGRAEFGSTPFEQPELLAERSPISYIGGVTAPTLILQGADDHEAPVAQAEQWFAGLYAQGKPVQMVLYPGADHDLPISGAPTHRIDFNRRFADWVLAHAGREASHGADPDRAGGS